MLLHTHIASLLCWKYRCLHKQQQPFCNTWTYVPIHSSLKRFVALGLLYLVVISPKAILCCTRYESIAGLSRETAKIHELGSQL